MATGKYTWEVPDPQNPSSGHWTIGVHEAVVNQLIRASDHARLARLAVAQRATTEDLVGIVKGWGRPQTDQHYVYFGSPQNDRQSATIEKPAPPNCFFVVFVQDDGTVSDWNWRKKDSENPLMPEGILGEILWQ